MSDNNAAETPPMLAIAAAPAAGSQRAESSGGPVRQPRQPHNLQGLLRFTMEATRAEDAPGNSELGPMDEERRKFLEEALRSLTVDVAQVLQESTQVLSDADRIHSIGSDERVPEDIESALNNLLDFVDDIDVANDFYKVGGFAVFPVLLGAQCDALRANACKLLAVICQNNTYTQARALETGLLNIVINMAENEVAPCVVAMTASALSCCVREYEPACREFISQNGCSVLLRLLNFDDIGVRLKAAFLIGYLCKHYPDAKDQLLRMNLVSDLARLLSGERTAASEHILSTLVTLIDSGDPAALEHILDPSNRLKGIVEQYMIKAELDEGTDYIEEREYCEEILKVVGDVKPFEDAVER